MRKNFSKFIPIMFLSSFLFSCHKERSTPPDGITFTHPLAHFKGQSTIRIRQATIVYDSAAWLDSLDVMILPARQYAWTMLPSDDSAKFSGQYKNGRLSISFGHAGEYKITAKIYDSLGRYQIGQTDTIGISVTPDTLQRTQLLSKDDQLTIRYIVRDDGQCPPVSTTRMIGLRCVTAKAYDNYPGVSNIDYTVKTDDGISLDFSDSVRLPSYPFVWGDHSLSPLGPYIYLYVVSGAPTKLRITWLNKTYTGFIRPAEGNKFSFDWDNSGAVQILQ